MLNKVSPTMLFSSFTCLNGTLLNLMMHLVTSTMDLMKKLRDYNHGLNLVFSIGNWLSIPIDSATGSHKVIWIDRYSPPYAVASALSLFPSLKNLTYFVWSMLLNMVIRFEGTFTQEDRCCYKRNCYKKVYR